MPPPRHAMERRPGKSSHRAGYFHIVRPDSISSSVDLGANLSLSPQDVPESNVILFDTVFFVAVQKNRMPETTDDDITDDDDDDDG